VLAVLVVVLIPRLAVVEGTLVCEVALPLAPLVALLVEFDAVCLVLDETTLFFVVDAIFTSKISSLA